MSVFACPYCGRLNTDFVRQKEAWPGTDRYFVTDYALRHCSGCGLFFAAPVNAQALDGMKRYFTEYYNNADRGFDHARMVEKIWCESVFKKILREPLTALRKLKWRLSKFTPEFGHGREAEALQLLYSRGTKTLLDVGCSFGSFVKAASHVGIRSYGVEPSREVVQLINAHGISNISEGFFPEGKGKLARYDALTFIHVLFQFRNLAPAFFRACRESLKPNGTLLVFCTDPRHIGRPEIEAVVRSPVALNFTGEDFMRRVTRDVGFSNYEYVACQAEPQCCFHLLTV